jgi:SWI/SNF-related matrix-associated actin-dependent regulator 1 of chromatin subfamily A
LGVKVSYDSNRKVFICRCEFNERHIPGDVKFFWNPVNRWWETKKLSVAIRLREYFDETAKLQISHNSVEVSPWPDGPLRVPFNHKLKPYQAKGVWFALNRNHSYLAFEQGLGKTPTAIVIINMVMAQFQGPALIICPPFLIENWKRELSIWLYDAQVSEIDGKGLHGDPGHEVILLPDTLLDRPAIIDYIKQKDFGLLIIEEAHRFKTPDAKRTKGVFEIAQMIPKVVCLSGTPMPNRPAELFPVLSALAHNVIGFLDFHNFGTKFCGAHQVEITIRGQKQYKWDYSGASNLLQLNHMIQNKFMLRYDKAEMLPELEPKEERAVILSGVKRQDIRKMEAALLKKFGREPEALLQKRNLGQIAEYRKEVGFKKVKPALEYVKNILDSTDEKLLILAWHHEVLDALSNGLSDYMVVQIDGGVNARKRDDRINLFQNSDVRVVVAQINTMVGYNMTAASRAIFVESSWSPADNAQAADRLHRIGQKNSVTVDYLVLANSLDERIVTSFITKQKNISRVIG